MNVLELQCLTKPDEHYVVDFAANIINIVAAFTQARCAWAYCCCVLHGCDTTEGSSIPTQLSRKFKPSTRRGDSSALYNYGDLPLNILSMDLLCSTSYLRYSTTHVMATDRKCCSRQRIRATAVLAILTTECKSLRREKADWQCRSSLINRLRPR
jgi:hypothetical protein